MRGHAVGGRATACRLDRTCIHIRMHVACRDRDPDDRPAWDAVSTFAGDGEDANLHSPVYIICMAGSGCRREGAAVQHE